MFGPVILPLDLAVTAVASAERLAEAGVASAETQARTQVHRYAIARDARGMLTMGHSSHSSHASHASSSGGGVGWPIVTPVSPVVPVPVATAPSAPASPSATATDGAADVSWAAPAVDGGSEAITYVVTAHPLETTVRVVGATTTRFAGLRNGTRYTFTVVAVNSVGESPVSTSTEPVTPVAPQLPSHRPVIVGKAVQGRTLRVETPGWADGTVFTYRWRAAGRDVVGAVGRTFRPRKDDIGKRISVVVTGTNPAFALGAPATSAATHKVARVGRPTVTGTAAVGAVLHAHPGRWTAGTHVGLAWFVGGRRVKASGPTLVVKEAYVGKAISVRLTGRRSGYDTVVVTSGRTRKVRG